jgi:ribosomal-protein-alanine N-acetyltransferase
MPIRPMTMADLATVIKIEEQLFPTDAWTKDMFIGELSQVPTSRAVVVLEVENQIIGYASLRFVGREADVNTIAISPDFQRRGFGNELLNWLLNKAKELKVQEIFLDVRADNTAAIEMYRAAGFELIDIRRNYYDHKIDAQVLRKKIT